MCLAVFSAERRHHGRCVNQTVVLQCFQLKEREEYLKLLQQHTTVDLGYHANKTQGASARGHHSQRSDWLTVLVIAHPWRWWFSKDRRELEALRVTCHQLRWHQVTRLKPALCCLWHLFMWAELSWCAQWEVNRRSHHLGQLVFFQGSAQQPMFRCPSSQEMVTGKNLTPYPSHLNVQW